MSIYYSLFFLVTILFNSLLCNAQNDTVKCPLDFTILRSLVTSKTRPNVSLDQECQYIRQGLRLVESHYLQLTNSFLPPLNSSESCWRSYQTLVDEYFPNFDIRSSCGFQTSWISQGCMNISTRKDFEGLVPRTVLDGVVLNCNQSLENNSPCAACTTSLSNLRALYLNGVSVGNVSDCQAFPWIYAAAFANRFGPSDVGTAKCLFLLDFTNSGSSKKKRKVLILGVSIGCSVAVLVLVIGGLFLRRRLGVLKRRKKFRDSIAGGELVLGSGLRLDSIGESSTLVKYSFEEIKKATRNFSRANLLGFGAYGNVYRGFLLDGSEIAVKRFKNCSAIGDLNFAHEVEIVASVRHVNLIALRGYSIATTALEGHQRIIVCDLVRNGSLHDHLFGSRAEKLSWPIRQKIALGTARGLAYLHYGAQPTIIHRDIKASNILLDERFEPKLADFGLAKFTPEGMTHLSTRVAGTMGYVAPEYALYGQLTERSDVYSFGVVLLELLSGRKALSSSEDSQPILLTDWAWSLVRNNRALDVIEDGMLELGPPDLLEKYVVVAVLCSHPQLGVRPTMDQVVKMLETDLSTPSIPERPISLLSDLVDIERSVSSSGSGQLHSPTGYQPYTSEGGRLSEHREEEGSRSSSTSRTQEGSKPSSGSRTPDLL